MRQQLAPLLRQVSAAAGSFPADFTGLDHLELLASEVLPQVEDVEPRTPLA
ncbi:hypothetical protein ACWZEH_30160 [Streptomyces sp. QTS137]